MGLHLENEVAMRAAADKQTPTIISNNPVFFPRSVFYVILRTEIFPDTFNAGTIAILLVVRLPLL